MATGSLAIRDAVYVNDGFTGIIVWFWEIILNAADGDVIRVFGSVTKEDGTLLTGKAELKEFPVTSETNDLSGTFSQQFDIGEFGKFPEKAIIKMTIQSKEGNIIRQLDKKSLAVEFTGTQTEDPIPNPTMVDTRFDFTKTFFLKDGILAGTIEAFKTTAFNSFFNNTTLNLFAQTKNDIGQVIDLQTFPFTFGNNTLISKPVSVLGITSDSVTMELFVFDLLNRPFSAKNIHTFIDETEPPKPPPDNFLITATAENGFEIGGTVTKADLDALNDPSIGVASVNATIISEPTDLNITQTFSSIMNFLIANQIVEPQNIKITVAFDNNKPNKMYILDPLELDLVKIALPSTCATIINETLTNDTSQGFDFVLQDIDAICQPVEPPSPCSTGFHEEIINGAGVCVADDQNNPPPDSQFCESCKIWIFLFDTCPICEVPPIVCDPGFHEENGICVPDDPIPPVLNICFCVTFLDSSVLCFVLTPSDFAIFLNHPIQDNPGFFISSQEPCSNSPNNINDVLLDISNKLGVEPPPPIDGGINQNIIIGLGIAALVAAILAGVAISQKDKKKK